MWRAGRNSPLKPPFRPARIFVDFFGDFCDESPWGTCGKNEGAVADQMGTHLLLLFLFHRITRSGPLPLLWSMVACPTHISERLPRFPPSLEATVGRVRHTDMCEARRNFDEKKRKSTASR